MEHDLNLTQKMYKSAFSDKQIIEIKKKNAHCIDPIFTYSDSEIALKVCRNKLRIKLNHRPLCIAMGAQPQANTVIEQMTLSCIGIPNMNPVVHLMSYFMAL